MMVYYLVTTLYVLICMVLLLVVLLQQGKGDIAAAFGGGSNTSGNAALGSNDARLDQAWAKLRGFFRGIYTSFDTSLAPERLERAWPDGRLDRLRKLKGQYDPGNLFRDNFNIVPAA